MKEQLFKQYPQNDLNLDGLRRNSSMTYERFEKALNGISTALTLDYERAFNISKDEYIKIYNELKEVGYCFSENKRKMLENERNQLVNMVTLAKNDVDMLKTTIISLEIKLASTKSTLEKRSAELNERERKLSEFKVKYKEWGF